MPEASDGGTDPKEANSGGENRSRRDRDQHKKGHRDGKFEGRNADLKNSIYDVTAGKDTFTKTTREIAEYIGRTFEDAGEFRIGLVEMSLPVLVEPSTPADEKSVVQVEKWKQALARNKMRIMMMRNFY
jgi:hypothetical protein